jgi:hypothetical protein
MSINIKEIFQSDNLVVTQDKINYNFDQILANGGGPQGLKGEKGSAGAIGSVGQQGIKGQKGDTGLKGNEGSSGYWSLDAAGGSFPANSLIPKINPTGSGAATKPTNIVLGRDDTSYSSDAADKSALITLVNGDGGADWSDMIRIRLHDGTDYLDPSAAIRISPISAGSSVIGVNFKLLTLDGSSTLELQSNEVKLNDSTGSTKIRVTGSFTEIVGNTIFENAPITINSNSTLTSNGNVSLLGDNTIGATGKTTSIVGTVRVNPTGSNPASGKIFTATTTLGQSTWRYPYEITDFYPRHSIVFVNPVDIVETNFALTNASYSSGPSELLLSYKWYGRGKTGTRWAGWYLLYGQTNLWEVMSQGSASTFSYVPTNVPGSILVGASAPSTTFVTSDYDSSMGIDSFRPPTGYGTSYDPSLRGDYNGVGVTSGNYNPGDLLINFDDNTPSGSVYDVLNFGAVDNAAQLSLSGGNSGYEEKLAFMPLPMAIYLGRADLVYDYVSLVI